MPKKICEKSIFNVLFYRKHKIVMHKYEEKYKDMPKFENSTLRWVRYQAQQVDNIGFDNWYTKTDGPFGPPEYVKKNEIPFLYKFEPVSYLDGNSEEIYR